MLILDIKPLDDFTRFSVLNLKNNRFWLNCANGTVEFHLDKNEQYMGNFTKGRLFLSKLAVDYDPTVDCPLWKKTIKDIIPNEKDRYYLQRFFAYSLISRYFRWECFLFLYGIGYNGKGTILETWSKIFQKVAATKIYEISEPFGKTNLIDTDFLFADESDQSPKTLADIKAIASGSKTSINRKYAQPYDIVIDLKIAGAANKLLKINNLGDKRKMLFIRCPNVFRGKDNVNLRDELEAELSGVLNWALEGLHDVLYDMPNLKKRMSTTTEEQYEKLSSPFDNFCDMIIFEEVDNRLTTEEIQLAYMAWSKRYKHNSLSNRQIGSKINKYFNVNRNPNVHAKKITKSKRGFVGLAINEVTMSNIDDGWRGVHSTEKTDDLSVFEETLLPKQMLMEWLLMERKTNYKQIKEKAKSLGMSTSHLSHTLAQWKRSGQLISISENEYEVNA